MSYLTLKYVHISCAVLSALGFLLRASWMLVDSPRLQLTWVRILPHVLDTLLLLTAITLVVLSGQYPWQQPWLAAKLCALVIYVGCGSLALRRAPTKKVRSGFLLVAVLALTYIFAVALTRKFYVAW